MKNALKLNDIQLVITKLKDIDAYFRRSTVAKKKLDFFQKQKGQDQIKRLVQSVDTRWNSVYYMVERFLELNDASLAVLGPEDMTPLTNTEIGLLREISQVLSPIKMATKSISSEKYVTLSSVIILTNCLVNVYATMQNHNPSFSAAAAAANIVEK